MATASLAGPRRTVRGVRRAAIIVVVLSLAVAAALGIVALLSGEFGDLQVKVLLTTLVVAAFGTTALCHLAVVARAVRVVGFTGIAASAAAAAVALLLIWEVGLGDVEDEVDKALGVLAVLAVSLAQANLLLLLARRRHAAIRASLGVTLAAIAIVAVMIWLPLLTDGDIPGPDADFYWRWLGVAGILDALGTIALPVLGLVLRGADPVPEQWGAAAGGPRAELLELELSPELRARLDAAASAAGVSEAEAARQALEQGLPQVEGRTGIEPA